jgi:hypothetical protein
MARKKSQEELDYHLLLENVREVCKSSSGKELVWYILSLTDLYGDSFTGNSQTFYLEGKRAVGLSILQLLEDADPTLYARLLLDKQKLEEQRNEGRTNSGDSDTDTDSGDDD